MLMRHIRNDGEGRTEALGPGLAMTQSRRIRLRQFNVQGSKVQRQTLRHSSRSNGSKRSTALLGSNRLEAGNGTRTFSSWFSRL